MVSGGSGNFMNRGLIDFFDISILTSPLFVLSFFFIFRAKLMQIGQQNKCFISKTLTMALFRNSLIVFFFFFRNRKKLPFKMLDKLDQICVSLETINLQILNKFSGFFICGITLCNQYTRQMTCRHKMTYHLISKSASVKFIQIGPKLRF